MKNEDIIKIKGRSYVSESGKSIEEVVKTKQDITPRNSVKSARLHNSNQKSKTLMRKAVPRPNNVKTKIARSMDIAKSSRVARFAPNPIIKSHKTQPLSQQSTFNPLISKVNRSMELIRNSQPAKTLTEIKEEAIKKSIEQTKPAQSKKPNKKLKFIPFIKNKYFLTVAFILTVTLSLYLSYQYIPAVSIRIAASQAGINASVPSYTLEGYGIYGPVTSTDNKVIIKYKDTSSAKTYTISQSYTNWDSSALNENLVKNWPDKSPNTTRVNGLTVYSTTNYDNVAWVNRNILYTITGDADLDSRKIERIVSSM